MPCRGVDTRTELKCKPCRKVLPTAEYTYCQKKRRHRRRCRACVGYALFLRGDGPMPADPPAETDLPEEHSRIQLVEQLLPPQQLTGVTHLKTIVVEQTPSGPGQRRARATEPRKDDLPSSYQTHESAQVHKSQVRKSRAERDVEEETLDDEPSVSSKKSSKNSKKGAKDPEFKVPQNRKATMEGTDNNKFVQLKKSKQKKPSHQRTPSQSDQARELYKRQLKGRRKIRASRDFDNEEEPPELLKGEKGRKRLSVLDGGYPRESMKPGPERVVGGGN